MGVTKLEHLVSDDVNCVEIYVGTGVGAASTCKTVVQVAASSCPNLAGFGAGHTSRYKDYYFGDMSYSYDLSNDGQRITSRKLVNDVTPAPKLYVMCFKETTLPSHRFPCTRNLSHTSETLRTTYRINNRMFINHDRTDSEAKGYVYIRYNHSTQVDLAKMQNDLDRVINLLMK